MYKLKRIESKAYKKELTQNKELEKDINLLHKKKLPLINKTRIHSEHCI